MNLKNYLKTHNLKPTPWAEKHGLNAPLLSRYLNGKGISPQNALKIEKATGGAVSCIELLYPEE